MVCGKSSNKLHGMKRKHAKTVADVYLAYGRALSAGANAEFADFVAEYTGPRGRDELPGIREEQTGRNVSGGKRARFWRVFSSAT